MSKDFLVGLPCSVPEAGGFGGSEPAWKILMRKIYPHPLASAEPRIAIMIIHLELVNLFTL